MVFCCFVVKEGWNVATTKKESKDAVFTLQRTLALIIGFDFQCNHDLFVQIFCVVDLAVAAFAETSDDFVATNDSSGSQLGLGHSGMTTVVVGE